MTLIKGRCDICDRKDGFRGHNLQECKRCHVKIHETCMGLISTNEKDPDWECLACQATKGGTLPRPTECALCSVNDGIHAMHPLYDRHGKRGKQLVLPPNKKKGLPSRRLWVHTLCAMFISSNPDTNGCVYGCDKDGQFEGESDDDDEDEDEDDVESLFINDSDGDTVNSEESFNEKQKTDDDDSETELMSTHHFVIAQKDKRGKSTPWTRRIDECRKLKCTFCGQKDVSNSFRIPVQCCWNHEQELSEFKSRHPENSGKEPCYVALHVGCGRWKKDDFGKEPSVKRAFFYPGTEVNDSNGEGFEDPVCNSYCQKHAQIIAANKQKKQTVDENVAKTNTTQPPKQSPLDENTNISQTSKMSPAAQELLRKRMELESQKQIKEKRKQEKLQKKEILAKKMREDLEAAVLPLFRAGAEKSKLMAIQKERKEHWAKQSKTVLQNKQFKKFWLKIRQEMQDSDQFKENHQMWENLQNNKETTPPAIHEGTIPHEGEGSSVVNTIKNDSLQEKPPQSNEPNPWKHLWVPNNDGKGFDCDEWDTFEYIDSL